jgi:hypothetical protein
VKIEWSKRRNPASQYPVLEPDTLRSVSFIEKDSRRFPDTNGWGYAQFLYDGPSDTSSLIAPTARSRTSATSAIRP